MVIEPTPGRIVWFWESKLMRDSGFEQPQAAIVTYVYGSRTVNLAVFDRSGAPTARLEVVLVQDGDDIPPYGAFAEWMPYQIGQAKKHAASAAEQEGK